MSLWKNIESKRREIRIDKEASKDKNIKVEQIAIMKVEMGDKARDILSRKEDTAYLGRNILI